MDFYLQSQVFWSKMALLLGIFALELAPMTSLVRWRIQLSRGETPDTRRAGRFARISYLQAGLLLLMVLAATAMARGFGVVPPG
jgi:putative membrane protein